MSDVECPYCEKWQEINHDDGCGYSEDEIHQQDCSDCYKRFTFQTSIIFHYEAAKAQCLNEGGEHKYEPTNTYPRKASRMRCVDCDKERPCTELEMKKILVV